MTATQIKKELRTSLRGLNYTSELILKKISYELKEREIIFDGIDTFKLTAIIKDTAHSSMFLSDLLSEELPINEEIEKISNIIRKDYHALSTIRGLNRKLKENKKDNTSRIYEDISLYSTLRNFGKGA